MPAIEPTVEFLKHNAIGPSIRTPRVEVADSIAATMLF
eukprot:CAMPEP_0171899780 /NCGR_PEP_ID=MMETSP0992-20121227/49430_1 /TAXON_ID=483369 /ORGANISM="non described non described, Strain CCMP2098" /LENGTH=37 /DNA_ID= /DNA_START= /DNA_END= /DNA_ORIENTATION=